MFNMKNTLVVALFPPGIKFVIWDELSLCFCDIHDGDTMVHERSMQIRFVAQEFAGGSEKRINVNGARLSW